MKSFREEERVANPTKCPKMDVTRPWVGAILIKWWDEKPIA